MTMQRSGAAKVDAPETVHPWELRDDDNMPTSRAHEVQSELLKSSFAAWVSRKRRDASVESNMALRWDVNHRTVGVDPDVCVVEPAPPEGDGLKSLLTWKPGHSAPKLAVEIVSENRPAKDYLEAPEKYRASGTGELWIFDPEMLGTRSMSGPFLLQVYQRDTRGRFRKVHQGAGPVFSPYLAAWAVVVDGARGEKILRIADDPLAIKIWPTLEEAALHQMEFERAAKETERAAKETERAAKETERAAKETALKKLEAALVEVELLKRALANRSGAE